MKTYFILFALSFCSLVVFSQKKALKKGSPFTAIKWEKEQPIVQFENEWYSLKRLDSFAIKELLVFCKAQFGSKWQKRFSEDLVAVLKEMGAPPNSKVALLLSDDTQQKNVIGTYTLENRQKVLAYNNEVKKKLNKITVSQAFEDILEFQLTLEEKSSYLHLVDFNYKSALHRLKTIVLRSKNDIDINYLTYELAKIMAELGDRHSSVKNEAFVKESHATYNLQLPFSIVALNGKAIAVNRIDQEGIYEYLHTAYPYIKSINGIPISTMIDSLVYKSKKAPKQARFSSGLYAIQQLGKLYFINNLKLPKAIEIIFTNNKTDKIKLIKLQKEPLSYYSKLERNRYLQSIAIKKGNFKCMSKVLKGNIGYIALPEMYHFDQIKGLERYIDSTFTAYLNTKALIIDLRFNPGGSRELIKKMGSYIIPKSKTPWVANVAYLRTNDNNFSQISMSNRFLYTTASKTFNALDRKSIEAFSQNFTTQKQFDTSKFSNPHYMVLESGNKQYTKPIYILVNQHSFSAASVFTSVFKGLPNVEIVGVTTDGSSGNSKYIILKNSNIKVKLSTMLSFQRNGKILDGNGTVPDIIISENEAQVLNGIDNQLVYLIERIKSYQKD